VYVTSTGNSSITICFVICVGASLVLTGDEILAHVSTPFNICFNSLTKSLSFLILDNQYKTYGRKL